MVDVCSPTFDLCIVSYVQISITCYYNQSDYNTSGNKGIQLGRTITLNMVGLVFSSRERF